MLPLPACPARRLQSAANGDALPAPLVRGALLCTLLLLMWRLRQLDPEFPEAESLEGLAAKRARFMTQLESIADCSDSQEVKDEVGGRVGGWVEWGTV